MATMSEERPKHGIHALRARFEQNLIPTPATSPKSKSYKPVTIIPKEEEGTGAGTAPKQQSASSPTRQSTFQKGTSLPVSSKQTKDTPEAEPANRESVNVKQTKPVPSSTGGITSQKMGALPQASQPTIEARPARKVKRMSARPRAPDPEPSPTTTSQKTDSLSQGSQQTKNDAETKLAKSKHIGGGHPVIYNGVTLSKVVQISGKTFHLQRLKIPSQPPPIPKRPADMVLDDKFQQSTGEHDDIEYDDLDDVAQRIAQQEPENDEFYDDIDTLAASVLRQSGRPVSLIPEMTAEEERSQSSDESKSLEDYDDIETRPEPKVHDDDDDDDEDIYEEYDAVM